MLKFSFKNAAVLILSLFFWGFILKIIPARFQELGGDSAQYIILAQNIAQGGGYEAVNYPKGGFFYHYPPVFPLLLSGVIYLKGENIYLMHFLVALLGYLGLFFVYRIFREYLTEGKAFLITVLLAANPLFIIYSAKHILSDVPYFLISSAALFFAAVYFRREKAFKYGILTLTALLLSYFMRYIGITLFLGLIVLFIIGNRRKKAVFIFAGFIIPFVLWQILGRILNPDALAAYSGQFYLIDPYKPYLGTIFTHPGNLIIRFIEGVNSFYKTAGAVLFPFSAPWLYETSFLIILLGFWLKLKKDKTCVFNYYFICYVFMVIIWPYREMQRFILPVLPFVYFYFFIGLDKVLRVLFKDLSRNIFYTAAVLMLIFNVLSLYSRDWTDKLPESLQNFIAVHYWIRENADQKTVIVSRKPTVTSFYTHHQAVCYPFTLKSEKIWNEIKSQGVKYIIVDNCFRETRLYMAPFLYKYKDNLELVYRVRETGVFEIIK